MSRRAQVVVALAAALAAAWLVRPDPPGSPSECGASSPGLPPDSEPAPTPAPAPAPAPAPTAEAETEVEVEYGGCEYVLAPPGNESSPACVYRRGNALTLWVNHPQADHATITVDGRRPSTGHYTLEHEVGQGYRVPLDAHAETITVTVPGASPWSLDLHDEADLGPHARHHRAALHARVGVLQRRLRDGHESALPELERLIRSTLTQGLLSDAIEIGMGTSYFVSNGLGSPEAALQLLHGLEPSSQRYSAGRALLPIYLSRPLRLQGYRLEAAIQARRGSRVAMRIDRVGLMIDGLTEYSLLLAELGYPEAADHWSRYTLRLSEDHARGSISPLLEVVAATNLLLEQAGHDHEDARIYYAKLRDRSRPGGAQPWPPRHAIALLGLAELALLDHEPAEALEHLEQIDLRDLPRRKHTHALDLELQTHLALGSNHQLLRAKLARLERLVPHTLQLVDRWRAVVRIGHVREALGEPSRARPAYEHSEELLDHLIPLAASGIGGELLTARHDEGTQRLLSLLLRGPDPRVDQALCVARHAQARLRRLTLLAERLEPGTDETGSNKTESAPVVRYRQAKRAYEALLYRADTLPADEYARVERIAFELLQQLQRIALELLSTNRDHAVRPPCEQLAARQPGELLLGLYPLGDELLVIASDDEGSAHHRVPDRDQADPTTEPAAAAPLLTPIDARVERASRIRVLAGGDASRIPVHALTWGTEPLGLQRPVTYGLDLPVRPEPEPGPEPGPYPVPAREHHAVVLQHSEVVGAADIARYVSAQLEQQDFSVRSYSTRQGRARELRKDLADAEHFFYAGHAYFTEGPALRTSGHEGLWPPYAGGAATEPSYLPLDDVARLEVADILMMHPAPSVVVLMGCATGITDHRTVHGGQSLASAFLSAGARVALATTRQVDDDQAFLLGRGLYRLSSSLAAQDPGRWMQLAMRWALDNGWDRASIADYRVFVP